MAKAKATKATTKTAHDLALAENMRMAIWDLRQEIAGYEKSVAMHNREAEIASINGDKDEEHRAYLCAMRDNGVIQGMLYGIEVIRSRLLR